MNDLKVEFQRWQSEGFLGDPAGENAYAYLRASSEKQVEEGSSFPRQIEHIHKAALRDHLRVPLELIFFDDGFTGFEFEHRPALLKLRHEAFSKARASHLVIEDIDRLSRNADWQQGFLLEELTRHQVEVHFFINPGSQLERYVRGYIAQEGMKKDIERMRMGTLYKAMDGRITAKRPRYGYVITDRRNSHYVLHPDESKIVRQVYEKMIYEGWSLKATCRWLNDRGIPSRFRPQWEPSALQKIISSTVYKGEFIANKLYFEKTDRLTPSGRPAYVERVRPESEWIVIPVPAVVTPEEWQMAQDALRRNNLRSMRNGKRHSWLVQGILRCDVCREFAMCTGLSWPSKSSKHRMVRYYKCNSRASEKKRLKGDICKSPLVKADLLERKVWEKVEEVIYHPDLIISRLEQRNHEEYAVGIQEQIAYIDQQLAALAKERSKYEAAYERDIYSLDEFEAKMFDLRAKNEALIISRSKLEAKLAEAQSIEDQKAVVRSALAQLRREVERAQAEQRMPEDLPFDLKRRIISLLVDTIWVNTIERTFTIEGEIKGKFALDDIEVTDNGSGGGGVTSPSTDRHRRSRARSP